MTANLKSVTRSFAIRAICFLICMLGPLSQSVYSQDAGLKDSSEAKVTDVGDVFKKLFKKKTDTLAKPKKSRAILPSFGYNPSFGFVIGAKVSALKQLGDEADTDLSAFGLEALYTSKGIITAQVRHSIYTAGNKWNLQGNWQLSKFLITDYSIGTGNKDYRTNSDSAFLIKFNYIRFAERAYRKVGKHFYVGAGLNMNIRSKIDDADLEEIGSSPHARYSARNGFDPTKYSLNGMLLAVEYNSREHPLRAYSGTYAELAMTFNQEWLGSTKNSIQVMYDLRKYISLSNTRPEHVLALWHTGSYKVQGSIPYLALPATGYDTYNRSGRGYTIGRFKGPAFAYFEAEYRFPITRNKLIGGVAFINVQSASDDLGKKLFQYLDPAGGGGLRILLEKGSRSTLCIDYSKGKYGSSGFFFGLNEVF